MNVRKCPKCGSFNLVPEIGGATGMWKCKKCGYVGSFFIELTIDEKSKPEEKHLRLNK